MSDKYDSKFRKGELDKSSKNNPVIGCAKQFKLQDCEMKLEEFKNLCLKVNDLYEELVKIEQNLEDVKMMHNLKMNKSKDQK